MSRLFVLLTLFFATNLVALPAALAIDIDWTAVGNPGNAADSTGYGAVAYNYNIGKYDVTVGQYTAFLNSVAATDTYSLYSPWMASTLSITGIGISRSGSSGSYTYGVIGSAENLPVTFVSWGDAARFSNWLQNGQPTGVQGPGTTETGAYTLNGATSNAALNAITRNPGATIFIPSENEWYKAAYYNPVGTYNQYPFSSNTVPISTMPGSTPNTGNFISYDDVSGNVVYAVTGSTILSISQNYLTPVGAYTASASPYGAYDMGGDVFQWHEDLDSGFARSLRGGAWIDDASYLQSSYRSRNAPAGEFDLLGFRVASVPEPGTGVLAILAFGILWALRTGQRNS
jgi:sulfatase modifying factor 1